MDATRNVMTTRRLFVGVSVLAGLTVLTWVRADGRASSTACSDSACVEIAPSDCGANHAEAAYRFRTNQSHHWRQMMIGGH